MELSGYFPQRWNNVCSYYQCLGLPQYNFFEILVNLAIVNIVSGLSWPSQYKSSPEPRMKEERRLFWKGKTLIQMISMSSPHKQLISKCQEQNIEIQNIIPWEYIRNRFCGCHPVPAESHTVSLISLLWHLLPIENELQIFN